MGETVQHEPDHGELDHGLRDFGQFLVVLGKAPPASEPAEGSLGHPAAWDDGEALGPSETSDDDQRQAEEEAGEQGREPVVALLWHFDPENEPDQALSTFRPSWLSL